MTRARSPFEDRVFPHYFAARDAWPHIALSSEVYASYVRGLLRPEAEGLDDLAHLHTEDIYLACACLHGDPRAMRAFVDAFSAPIEKTIVRLGAKGPSREDIAQSVFERILIGGSPSRAPKLTQYSGRGALIHWVRVVAARVAQNTLSTKQGSRELLVDDHDLFEHLVQPITAEEEHLMSLYEKAVCESLDRALASLTERERTLLRLHVVDGLTIDDFAARFSVHRSTAARKLQRARTRLQESARDGLVRALRIGRHEVESILDRVQSRIDLGRDPFECPS